MGIDILLDIHKFLTVSYFLYTPKNTIKHNEAILGGLLCFDDFSTKIQCIRVPILMRKYDTVYTHQYIHIFN